MVGSSGWAAALGLVVLSCSGHTATHRPEPDGGSASGTGGRATGNTAGSGAGGAPATGGAAEGGAAEVGGAAAAGASGSGEGGLGAAGAAGASAGAGGAPISADPLEILKVKPSAGCGKAAAQATGAFVKHTLQTSGTKDPNCADGLSSGAKKCGAWSLVRDYYVWLPPDYQATQAYPLVLQAPGCGGDGTQVYSLSPSNTEAGVGVNGTVIRVGLTPPPNEIGHATNPGQGCFDDKEGDDSVDFVFYETLRDKLKSELCFDENRVFASGNSSGAWLANELGCKYAGNTQGYALRGVAINTGGLPTEPQFTPTCTQKPMAGVWIWENGDTGAGFNGNSRAVARAMQVNACQLGSSIDDAQLEDFPIGGGLASATCRRILGCPVAYPLVVCLLPGNEHGGHDAIVNPAFATFLRLLAAP